MRHRGPYMLAAVIISVMGFIFVAISFATDQWWVSFNPKNNFINCGMWAFCFNNYVYPRDYWRKQYDGCWYVWGKQLFWIRELIIPPWFIACQTLEIIVILCSGISMLIALATYITDFSLNVAIQRTRVTLGFKAMEAVCQLIVLIIFAERATGDWQWIPMRMENQFSWSYGIAVLASFCSASAIVPLYGYHVELKEQYDELHGKEYDMYLRDRF